MIQLGISGLNLTIKPLTEASKAKIYKAGNPTAITKNGNIAYFELPKSSLDAIYSLWDEDEIEVSPKHQAMINELRFSNIPLEDLKEEDYWCPDDILLADYQDFFVSRDYRKTNIGTFLETGAGKAAMLILRAYNSGFKKMLVFSTKTNYADWVRDLNWLIGKTPIQYTGTKKQRDRLDLSKAEIVFTNYEQAKEIIDRFSPDCLILDEAQECANPDTKAHKNILAIKKKHKPRQVLLATATPLESKLDELWGLLHILNPQIAGSRDSFLAKFQKITGYIEIKYERYGREYSTFKPTAFEYINLPELRRLLSTTFYRTDTSKEFKFEDITEIVKLEMPTKQKDLYEKIKQEILLEVERGTFDLENPMARTMQLLKAATSTAHFHDGEIYSNKIDWVLNFVKTLPKDTKVIFWSRFKLETEILGEQLPDCVVLNGDIKSKDLVKLAFQGARNDQEKELFYRLLAKYPDFPFKDPGSARYLAATTNGKLSAGMNLPAASVQVVLAQDPSARSTKQYLGRCKRKNTTHDKITTIILVSKGTIEFRLSKLIYAKIASAGSVLDGKGSLTELRNSDILKLIYQTDEDD